MSCFISKLKIIFKNGNSLRKFILLYLAFLFLLFFQLQIEAHCKSKGSFTESISFCNSFIFHDVPVDLNITGADLNASLEYISNDCEVFRNKKWLCEKYFPQCVGDEVKRLCKNQCMLLKNSTSSNCTYKVEGQPTWKDGIPHWDSYTFVNSTKAMCTSNAFGDEYNCFEEEFEELKIKTIEIENVTCWGAMDGAIYNTIEGGVPPYFFKWCWTKDKDHPTEDNIGLSTLYPSEDYHLNVSDSLKNHMYKVFTIYGPPKPEIQIINVTKSCPSKNSGSIVVKRIENASIIWNDTSNGNKWIRSGLKPGFYEVVVDIDCCTSPEYRANHWCNFTKIVEIVQTDLEVKVEVKNTSAKNSGDGEIKIYIIGGSPPFQVSILNKTFEPRENNFSITNKKSGIYRINVQDSDTCETDIVAIVGWKNNLDIYPSQMGKVVILVLGLIAVLGVGFYVIVIRRRNRFTYIQVEQEGVAL